MDIHARAHLRPLIKCTSLPLLISFLLLLLSLLLTPTLLAILKEQKKNPSLIAGEWRINTSWQKKVAFLNVYIGFVATVLAVCRQRLPKGNSVLRLRMRKVRSRENDAKWIRITDISTLHAWERNKGVTQREDLMKEKKK